MVNQYQIGFVFKTEKLSHFLSKIPPGKLISLLSQNHVLGLVGDKDREVYTLFDANGFLQESGEGYLFEKKFLKENINELIIDLKKGLFYEPNCNEIGLIITICDSMMGPSLNVSLPVEIIKSLLDKRMKEHGSVNIDAANSYNEASSLYFAASIG